MKRKFQRSISITFLLIIFIFFSGCKPRIVDDNTYIKSFSNQDIEFTVTENVLSDENSVTIDEGIYIPEVDILCFDITYEGHQEHYTYEVVYEHITDIGTSLHYTGSGPDEEGKDVICHPELEYSDYTIRIGRYIQSVITNTKRQTLAEIKFNDPDFSDRELYTFSIEAKEANRVDFLGDPYISFDIISSSNFANSSGQLLVKLITDSGDHITLLELTKDDFDLVDGKLVLKDIIVTGFAIDHRYYVALSYKTDDIKDRDFGIRQSTTMIESSKMEGYIGGCGLGFLCGFVYNTEVSENDIRFDAYLYTGYNHLSNEDSKIYTVTANVYNLDEELLYSVEVKDGSFEVPKGVLPENGFLNLEANYFVQYEEGMFASNELKPYILSSLTIKDNEVILNP